MFFSYIWKTLELVHPLASGWTNSNRPSIPFFSLPSSHSSSLSLVLTELQLL